MKLILNPEYGLYEKGGQVFCDSLQIAETFEKRHADVLRDIEKLTEPASGLSERFGERNFALSSYKSKQGKKLPCYYVTRDGFTVLVMGYTGAKAMRFKEAYIARFNEMEYFIKSLQSAKMEFPAFTNAIMEAHEEPKHYHFSNEINMINRIVLGVTAKQFKAQNGLDKSINSIRPYLDAEQIQAVEELQRVDIGLIVAGLSFDSRKQILTSTYARHYLLSARSA